MKLSIGLAGWFAIPLEKALRYLSELGYDGVEIYVWKGYIFDHSVFDPQSVPERGLGRESRKRLKGLINKYNLDVPAVGLVDFAFNYRNPCEATREKHVEFVKDCIDFGSDLDARVIWSMSGPALKDMSREQSWEKLEETMQECVINAEEKEMTYALEPCQGQLVSSANDCLRLIENVPQLRVNFDPSHFSIRGWDVPAAVDELSRHIVFTHLKGTRGMAPNHEWYIPGEYQEDRNTIEELALSLRKIGYEGYVSVEIAHKRRMDILYDPIYSAELAYNAVSSMLASLGLRNTI